MNVNKGGIIIVGVILLTTIISLFFSIIFYAIGYYGGYKIIEKLYIRHKGCQKSIDRCRKLFTRYSRRTLFFARMIPFSRTYISLFAGACRQDLFSYIISSLFGIVIWNTIFVSLGVSLYFNLSSFFDLLIILKKFTIFMILTKC